MELSSEDALRLNVLLANKPLAIRIHESNMTLHGLFAEGEAKVQLNPSGSDGHYLKAVRAFLSERALGNPGGYPLYLQRWTRQGQMRGESLEQLLLLGDETAVFAVVCAVGLTDELARRAWWSVEDAENARRMLETEAVVNSETGKLLANYLIDYLPFETESETMVESVSRALQPGLLDQELRQLLWKKAARKTAYLVGFIAATPDDLPADIAARSDHQAHRAALESLAEDGSEVAGLLLKLLSAAGQSYLDTCSRILTKPTTQDVVNTTLDLIRGYFSLMRPEGNPDCTIETLIEQAPGRIAQSVDASACLEAAPQLRDEIEAMDILSGLGYGLLRPALKGSDAMGSLMRKKLEPVLKPVMEQIEILRTATD